MKIFSSFVKFFIKIFCIVIKKNKSIKQYVFSTALKDEVIDYIENKYYSEYEHIKRSIIVFKKKQLNENFIILDIGGSTGKTSTIYSAAFPENKIYVFEPIKETFQNLSNNVLKFNNIIAVNKAVGNFTGTQKINIAKRISSSSLLELNADKNSQLFSENLETAGIEEIQICKLDDEIKRDIPVGIIKIDVQGYEVEVLKGARQLLECTYVVVVEVNNHEGYKGSPKYDEIDQILKNANFFLYDICTSTRENNRLKEWDVIYVNKKFYEDWNN